MWWLWVVGGMLSLKFVFYVCRRKTELDRRSWYRDPQEGFFPTAGTKGGVWGAPPIGSYPQEQAHVHQQQQQSQQLHAFLQQLAARQEQFQYQISRQLREKQGDGANAKLKPEICEFPMPTEDDLNENQSEGEEPKCSNCVKMSAFMIGIHEGRTEEIQIRRKESMIFMGIALCTLISTILHLYDWLYAYDLDESANSCRKM